MDRKSALALNTWLNDVFCLINKEDRQVIAVISKSEGYKGVRDYDVHIIDTLAEIARVTISECEILTETEVHGNDNVP